MVARKRPQVKVNPREGNPVSVRFGDRDPRAFAFDYLIGCIDIDSPPWQVNEAIAKLAGLGYSVTLTSASEHLPTLPVMTADEKAAYARGEWFDWMDPDHIAGYDS